MLPAASGEQERLWFHRFLRATGVVLPVAAGASLGLGLNGGWLEGTSASTSDFKPESPAHFEAAMVDSPSTVDWPWLFSGSWNLLIRGARDLRRERRAVDVERPRELSAGRVDVRVQRIVVVVDL